MNVNIKIQKAANKKAYKIYKELGGTQQAYIETNNCIEVLFGAQYASKALDYAVQTFSQV